MTFVKKLLDALNMDNWNKKGNVIHANTDDFSPTVYELIYTFWRQHPQIYCNSSSDGEVSADEYILYGTVLILWGYDKVRPLFETFPYYYEKECKISNPLKLQSILLQKGYIAPAPA